jgi:hypothetical protein
MKKAIRILSAALMAVMLMALMTACGGSSSSVKDDVAVSTIAQQVDACISGSEGLAEMDESYINGAMSIDLSAYSDYVIKVSSIGTSINEYGIFKMADGKTADEGKTAMEAYLQLRNDTWMSEYLPEEYPKLQKAEVTTAGNYVMYAILSDDERSAAFDAFNSALKG